MNCAGYSLLGLDLQYKLRFIMFLLKARLPLLRFPTELQ